MLSREAFLATNDIDRELVKCKLGEVWVRGMTAKEYEDYLYEAGQREKGDVFDLRGLKASVVVRGVVDDKGVPLFTDADIPALMQKSNETLNTLATAIHRLSGNTETTQQELEKNSESGQSTASITDSP